MRPFARLLALLTLACGLIPAANADTAQAIAAAGDHSCLLTSAGAVQCWGYNYSGQLGDGTTTNRTTPVQVSGLTSDVVAIAAGNSHTCALTSGGAVTCWGNNSSGQLGDGTTTTRNTPVQVSGLTSGVIAITAGGNHSCALTGAGGVQCWGANFYGQVGDNTTTQRKTPVQVSGLTSGITVIAAGGIHTCALTNAGAVKCWGYNTYGQLGDGTITHRSTPVQVSGLESGVTAISTGSNHSCARSNTGAASCWGNNDEGELGDNSTTRRYTPVAVSGLTSGVTTITAGSLHTCALTNAGAVKCWGYNWAGQLGDNTTNQRNTPVAISSLASGVAAIAAGASHTCALTTAGGVVCWGRNDFGQLGNNSAQNSSTSVSVVGFDDLDGDGYVGSADAFPMNAAAAVDTDKDGKLDHWNAGCDVACQTGSGLVLDDDDDNDGVLDENDLYPLDPTESADTDSDGTGDNGDNCPFTPNADQLNTDGDPAGNACDPDNATPLTAKGIAAGYNHNCLLTSKESVQCWGKNDLGQLGDSTTTNRTTPVTVSSLSSGVTAIAAGSYHTCAISSAGGVACWGSNNAGQLGDTTTTNRYTPVQVNGLASGVTTIAAGDYHTCAVTSSGAVKCWGHNAMGQLGDGTTTNRTAPVAVSGLGSGVTAIAATGNYTCALTDAGAVKCWGNNNASQLGDGTTINRTTPVAVSGLASGIRAITTAVSHACALTNAGGVKCWGSNNYGQLGDGTTTSRITPVAVSGLTSGVTAIAAGRFSHTCAVTTTGAAICWGWNSAGQLGDSTTTNRTTPVTVSSLSIGVTAIAAGSYHTCAITSAGGVACWGSNNAGQLGDGTTTNRYTPVFVSGFADQDGDGTFDPADAFPLNAAAAADSDHDGQPDSWTAGCDAACQAVSGLVLDDDDDDDGIPDSIDPLLSWVPLAVDGSYRGSSAREYSGQE